jgi:hypothetical protein
MIRHTLVVVLASLCGIAACQRSTAPPQVDVASVAAVADPQPPAKGDATPADPVLSPVIEEVRSRAHRDDMLALADDVAALGDARALALAAKLRSIGLWRDPSQEGAGPALENDATIRRWLDEAERMAPDDVTALVLSMDMLARDKARRSALIARWRRLEPGNLVPIFHAELPEDALFEAAATATVFDSHYDDALRTSIDLFSRVSSPALSRMRQRSPELGAEGHDATMIIAFWSASVMPGFQKISTPCRAEGLSDMRLRQCDRIARAMMVGNDVLLAEMIGTAMMRRLPTFSPEERAAAEAMDREKDWLLYRASELEQRDLRAYMTHFAAVLRAAPQTGERALMREVLRASGVPTAPPAGWRKEQDPAFPVTTR